MFDTNACCVERNIRTIINVIWNHNRNQYFGKKLLEKRPTNTQFFSMLIEQYQEEQTNACSSVCDDAREDIKELQARVDRIEKDNAELREIMKKHQD